MNLRKENVNMFSQVVSPASIELSDADLENVVGGCGDRRDHFEHCNHIHKEPRCHEHQHPHEHPHCHEHGHIRNMLPHI
jgi:hypothetical protein